MGVPKKKQTSGRTRRRRAGHRGIKKISLVKCPKCGELKRPHRMCNNCGYYKGRQIVDVMAKLEKKEKKKKEQEMAKTGKKKPLSAQELSRKK